MILIISVSYLLSQIVIRKMLFHSFKCITFCLKYVYVFCLMNFYELKICLLLSIKLMISFSPFVILSYESSCCRTLGSIYVQMFVLLISLIYFRICRKKVDLETEANLLMSLSQHFATVSPSMKRSSHIVRIK